MSDPVVPPPPPPGAGVPSLGSGSVYPVALDFVHDDVVSRWRPLVNWLLAIPQFVVLYFLQLVERALALLSFILVLFTKKIPDSIFDFRVMAYRYQWRVTSFAFFMRDEYPPFAFELSAADDDTDPARFSIERPAR